MLGHAFLVMSCFRKALHSIKLYDIYFKLSTIPALWIYIIILKALDVITSNLDNINFDQKDVSTCFSQSLAKPFCSVLISVSIHTQKMVQFFFFFLLCSNKTSAVCLIN